MPQTGKDSVNTSCTEVLEGRKQHLNGWERSGSVVECLTRDRGAAGSSLTGFTALCPRARHINPSVVLVQTRKTCPFITERLLIGRKETNQTNKNI